MFGILCYGASDSFAAGSHCSSEEDTIFSCSTGKKTISVCASEDLSASDGYLQYRFGVKGKPELVVPQTLERLEGEIKGSTLMFSGGGGAYLRFEKGQYDYIVYSAIGRGWGEKDGVAVEKNGTLVTSLKCKGSVISEIGPELFEQAGLPDDGGDFDLP